MIYLAWTRPAAQFSIEGEGGCGIPHETRTTGGVAQSDQKLRQDSLGNKGGEGGMKG